jgi:hypothetical protein
MNPAWICFKSGKLRRLDLTWKNFDNDLVPDAFEPNKALQLGAPAPQ